MVNSISWNALSDTKIPANVVISFATKSLQLQKYKTFIAYEFKLKGAAIVALILWNKDPCEMTSDLQYKRLYLE